MAEYCQSFVGQTFLIYTPANYLAFRSTFAQGVSSFHRAPSSAIRLEIGDARVTRIERH